MKIVYSDKKTGKSAQAEINSDAERSLIGKRIGDLIEGDIIGLSGYKLQITGGADSSGFSMNKHVQGSVKTGIFKNSLKKKIRTVRRKTVVGGSVSNNTAQINTLIIEYGSKPIEEIFGNKKEKTVAK